MGASIGQHRRETPARMRAEALAQQQEARLGRQADALMQLDCLRDVPHENLEQLAEASVLRAFVPGTVILHEHTPCEFVYFILRGTISLTLHDRNGQKVLIGVLNRGDCFGEGPLFGDLFRGASVTAETTCYLLQVPRERLREILPSAPEMSSALRTIYRRRLIESTLGQVPLFSQLLPVERARLASLLQAKHYPRGTTIIRQGETGRALYLIAEGQVVVEQGGHTLAHLDEGNFFGEMALLDQNPHNADVRALTPVEVLALPAADFSQLLQQQPELKAQLQVVVNRRHADNAASHRDQARSNQLNSAIQRGLLRGTHVLVRDPERCDPNCNLCVDACAARHGNSRIRLNGVLLHGLDVTDSCRQCRVGAECVEACPEDALEWNEHGALIVSDRCTGCGDCMPACPYDAIGMVPLHAAHPSLLWTLWHEMKRLKHPTIPLQAAQPAQHADKCDYCHGYDDLACVSACPSGALRLAPVDELFPL